MFIRFVRAIKCTRFNRKCYSFLPLLGRNLTILTLILTATLVLVSISGCQTAGFQVNDGKTSLFESDNSLFSDISEVQSIQNPVIGALISSNPAIATTLLNTIDQKDEYSTVVLLASTSHKTEKDHFFTYGSKGILKNSNFQLADDPINRLINAGLIADLGSIGEQSYWNNALIQALPGLFPYARFIVISINEETAPAKTQILAYALKTYLPQNSIVLALSDFQAPSESLPQNIQEYQSDFAKEVLQSLDFDKFDELPFENNVSPQALGAYLRYMQANTAVQPANNLALADSSLQVIFQKITDKEQSDIAVEKAEKNDSTVYLVSFGDIMLGRYVRHLMDGSSLDYPFEQMDNSYLKINDLLFANLEGPVTEKAVRTITGMNFGFYPDVTSVLNKYHFDVLSQANNHAFDKGTEAYQESLGYLRNAGFIVFGNPNEITEDSVAFTHVRGHKFAFFGLEEVNTGINDEKAVEKVKELSEKGYKVIVSPHWGIEYRHSPSTRQKELGHKLIDAGAYAIIGHHPHVVQTIENYKGHPIIYSLGNAIFDQYWSAPTQEGLSVAMKLKEDQIEIYLVPIKLPGSRFQIMEKEAIEKFYERFITWGEYSDEEKDSIKQGKLLFQLTN